MANSTPLISVIVPVYNTAPRLRACLESIANQSHRNLQVLLIDDGSQDGSALICQDFAAADPRFVAETIPHGGVSAARNRGLELAKGEWIAFCDSDDFAEPQMYQRLLENAQATHSDLSFCAMVDVGPDTPPRKITNFPFEGEKALLKGQDEIIPKIFLPLLQDDRNVHGYLIPGLFRAEIIRNHNLRFARGVAMMEDELFLMSFVRHCQQICADSTVLYRYLRFATSACSRFYRTATDFEREENWYLRAVEQQRIFKDAGLAEHYPFMARLLHLRVALHWAQMCCCRPGCSYLGQLRRLKVIARDAKINPPKGFQQHCGMGAKLFWFTLFHAKPFLPALLAAKRWKDWFDRTMLRRANERRAAQATKAAKNAKAQQPPPANSSTQP